LYENVLELWCSIGSPAKKIHSTPIKALGRFLCFFQLPRAVTDGEKRNFLAVTDAKESFAWCIDFAGIIDHGSDVPAELAVHLVGQGPFPSSNDMHLVTAVDPMGWRATINSESLDVYTREVLVTVSKDGRLQTWTTNLSKVKDTVSWLNLSTIQTNISQASLVHGTSERKVAMGIYSNASLVN
jgi:hypothetical protein